MPATPIRTCPLCGLRFANSPLLELHIREDHPRRPRGREAVPEPGASPSANNARPPGG